MSATACRLSIWNAGRVSHTKHPGHPRNVAPRSTTREQSGSPAVWCPGLLGLAPSRPALTSKGHETISHSLSFMVRYQTNPLILHHSPMTGEREGIPRVRLHIDDSPRQGLAGFGCSRATVESASCAAVRRNHIPTQKNSRT